MTDTFDDRRKGYEAKWAHDEELRFKVMARRNKLLGLWAAGEMGITGEAAQSYAKTVVAADFEEAGEEDVFRKVSKDLGAGKDSVLRHKMEELLQIAGEQVTAEAKK